MLRKQQQKCFHLKAPITDTIHKKACFIKFCFCFPSTRVAFEMLSSFIEAVLGIVPSSHLG